MALAAQMICDVRTADRLSVELDATLRDATSRPIGVEIDNISASGFSMVTTTALSIGDLITVGIAGLGMQPAIVVRHDAPNYGCRFVVTLSPGTVDALLEPQATVTPFPRSELALPLQPATTTRYDVEARYSTRTRMVIVFGLAAACWFALGAVAALIL
jgi:hypothetical protein